MGEEKKKVARCIMLKSEIERFNCSTELLAPFYPPTIIPKTDSKLKLGRMSSAKKKFQEIYGP